MTIAGVPVRNVTPLDHSPILQRTTDAMIRLASTNRGYTPINPFNTEDRLSGSVALVNLRSKSEEESQAQKYRPNVSLK
jgi:hypothetical protein